MAYKQTIFADKAVSLTVQDGIVRIDFAVYAGQVKDKDGSTKQRLEITSQLVIPLEGFVSSAAMQQKLIKDLAERQRATTGTPAKSDQQT